MDALMMPPSLSGDADALNNRPAVQIALSTTHTINFAMQQNHSEVIRTLTLQNNTGRELSGLELEIHANPAFALPFSQHLDLLPAGQTLEVRRPQLRLDAAFLADLTELVTGTLEVQLRQGEHLLASETAELTVLPFDHWQGTSVRPDLTAAFVTPNNPAIPPILSRATEFLGEWTGDSSMDGYLTQDPNRVLQQAAAIYHAIRELGIAYALPPASFAQGQRVRLCDAVVRQKLGTCVDLSLLYASCLEAAGLYPLLITTPSHVFTGLWLQKRMFPEAIQDDVSLITKRLASGVNEIAVAETTFVTTGRNTEFDAARTSAEHTLVSDELECIIDIHRCRLSGIMPLPQRIHTETGWQLPQPEPEITPAVPTELGDTVPADGSTDGQPLSKMAQWERKLLDLDLRNPLINLRLTRSQVPILTPSLEELENTLHDGADFRILPRPADLELPELSFEALQELGSRELLLEEFRSRRLRAACTDVELSKSLTNLYRTARTSLEESGANTLYLALGMLRWFETAKSTKARFAPIILLPVEMVRKSAAQGYVIRLRDDEPQMNITLLEKLKQDHGITVTGLDPLPGDEHGVDIRRVLSVMRRAVMDQSRWDVVESASLGIFSFSQFVMWNDIRNRADDLQSNKIVRSLMEGKLCWDAEPLEMGSEVSPDNVLLPVPADASQLFAIRSAAEGRSFVLHGPPGTGKSQTITALITNALAQGKRVLFAAEKMAALEVVQKRLEKIGLGPFCLELHSNKSRKKNVLEQLQRTIEVKKGASCEEFERRAERLAAMRAELDAYVTELHQMQPCGLSLYELIDRYENCRDAAELAPFSDSFLRSVTRSSMEEQELLLERLSAAAREIGHPHNHPLSCVGYVPYSQRLRTELPVALEDFEQALDALRSSFGQLIGRWSLDCGTTPDEILWLCRAAKAMEPFCTLPSEWARGGHPELFYREIDELAAHAISAEEQKQKLLERFQEDYLRCDGAALLQEWTENAQKWCIPRKIGENRMLRRLNVWARPAVTAEELEIVIRALISFQQEQALCESLLQQHRKTLGMPAPDSLDGWEALRRNAALALENCQMLENLPDGAALLQRCGGSPDDLDAIRDLLEAMPVFEAAAETLAAMLDLQTGDADLDELEQMAGSIRTHTDELKEWLAFRQLCAEASEAGLAEPVRFYLEGAGHEDVLPAYRRTLLRQLICMAIDGSDPLNTFSGAVFNEKIEQFRRADEQWQELSRQEARCRLAARIPDFTREAAQSSELGILQRCIRSGGRGVSIRHLFDQIPNLLPRLCPCMLMSPISAAQYLDPGMEPFDLVVFDEASQLPTCKAVGVLARGKEAVIVGDPKQMPPTSFFSVNAMDEDNLEQEDLESILDDCLALNMPQTHLLWHYRSRHESLIAFSNSQFYQNRLLTFPSVNDRASKVRLQPVDGVFDRSHTRTNRAEAEAVVEEIRRRATDPECRSQSVGVVTFNAPQQNLIDDLLNEACAADPDLEQWVYGSEEPVFIKNLENVQGDERDVILFSVGYGPDEHGKVYMNFGPLNREGGWRRLNVAVSRARSEMLVFSTLQPEQIDLARTKSEGVAALRSFLSYAGGHTLPISADAVQRDRFRRSAVAGTICSELRQAGYDTQCGVGRSKFRVDIGVVDPEHPERYLLGIVLDGDAYHSARTTRDREVAQLGVLERLGWNMLRVWTMDWWDNSSKELQRILRRLEELRQEQPPAPQPPDEPSVPAEKNSDEVPEPKVKAAIPAPLPDAPVYHAAVFPNRTLTAEEFPDPSHESMIRKRILAVLEAEAPICESLLEKRVVQSYGILRAGSRIHSHFEALLQTLHPTATTENGLCIFWNDHQNPEDYAGFRVNGTDDSRRDIREIPMAELRNCLQLVLDEQIGMNEADLLRETARRLGFARPGSKVLSGIYNALMEAWQKETVAMGANGSLTPTEKGMAAAERTRSFFRT